MPNTLLLRFKAPMQSWGLSSRFSIRDTGREPSKSGVIGLLCAALGISRDEANTDNQGFAKLANLKFGVRVLNPGILQSDYHTAQNIAKADGGLKDTELSTRWYLADADFLIGLESDDLGLLESLIEGVRNPRWQLFFGRKAFVPALPVIVRDALTCIDLESSLKCFEPDDCFAAGARQRLVIEDAAGNETRQDVPLCFRNRRFSTRRVRTSFFERETNGG